MRRLRRSSRNPTSGDPVIDRQNQALSRILFDMGDELRATEHCQDMNEFYDDLVDLAEQRFDAAAAGTLDVPEADEEIREFLAERMPLPARDGPACRDCGLCEKLEDRVCAWLPETVAA
ncbi:hypothetical protein [Thioalkalivibrio paradoxus]|uniref:Uncharacterized protein n=1 Tax=Thioalkalivibrio paradoxus ARh 1 TaxID=713585 RepID=W0DSU3_9GAMM|nr:hypothetical protein [Thioalkalivibrio paradoxus]AHF00059.1 hypothetical protein THITH_08160 [Thioalkalivibrio paradoxus ARh 1]